MQVLATVLFFIVFIELFVVLSVYLLITISTYMKKQQEEKHSASIVKKEEV